VKARLQIGVVIAEAPAPIGNRAIEATIAVVAIAAMAEERTRRLMMIASFDDRSLLCGCGLERRTLGERLP
jgi:hypothetical protein